ncbi:MAG: ABC transporter permease [Planctomycetes bacterium]|nr:ABC transporter permease [Planctomycetota bacterium]
MALVPLSYNLRSLRVRKSSTLLTIISVGATVAIFAGVLSLQQGFETLFSDSGREDVSVFLRPGAVSEGESGIPPAKCEIIKKSLPEVKVVDGMPLASAESFLAVRRRKLDGGETNVPIRGVEQMTFTIREGEVTLTEGRAFAPGSDEVIVGEKLVGRIQGCEMGETIWLNTVPFKVVGVFSHDGPFASEIWCDIRRMSDALERPWYSRVVAVLNSEADFEALKERMSEHKEIPAKVMDEKTYYEEQTRALSGVLRGLGSFLAVIMGMAAAFTATNTMLAALSSRSHEIGILLSVGFRPTAIFLSFLFEAVLLGLAGGLVGVLVAFLINGAETGTTNFRTFTEIAFAFRVTPLVLSQAVFFSLLLGLLGGAWPAWRASRMKPIEALRRT